MDYIWINHDRFRKFRFLTLQDRKVRDHLYAQHQRVKAREEYDKLARAYARKHGHHNGRKAWWWVKGIGTNIWNLPSEEFNRLIDEKEST